MSFKIQSQLQEIANTAETYEKMGIFIDAYYLNPEQISWLEKTFTTRPHLHLSKKYTVAKMLKAFDLDPEFELV